MSEPEIPRDHPRYESLKTREDIIKGMHQKVVAEAGLIAHGRGEAFDYILGEKTPEFALQQEEFAIITLLLAKHPVISVNGNVAVLCPKEIVQLSEILDAPLEINLFYRKPGREKAIEKLLIEAGAKSVLGLNPSMQDTIPEISHQRRIVDSRGIAISDCVFVPLEDGDRTLALRKMGKDVVTVDLNPLSRTSLASTVSITNNIIRAVKEMIKLSKDFKEKNHNDLLEEKKKYNNRILLQTALDFMSSRLLTLAKEKETFNLI
ncbi:MAG: phosphopantothenate/pantothenate synthetase [Candidatus Hodarchaeales archaeon]